MKKSSLQNENQCMWYLIWIHMEKIAQDLVFRRVMVLHDLEILVGERKSPFEWEKGFS